MKKILLFLFSFFSISIPFNPLFSLEFYINNGRENGDNFAVLTITDEKPFLCQEFYTVESEVDEITCEFEEPLLSRFYKSESLFFEIQPQSTEDRFFLNIYSKEKMRLFNNEFRLVNNTGAPIPKERNKKSRRWQIVGYIKDLPFIKKHNGEGINFPVKFRKLTPTIGALNVQMKPLKSETGGDNAYYLRISDMLAREIYEEALAQINEMLGLYPDTIFKRDVLYYRILALDGLENPDNSEDILELAKSWYAAYPTDVRVPEILYILAKTYASMNFFDEAKFYYTLLFNEYKGHKFEHIARIQYANNLYARGERTSLPAIYTGVLNETNDLEVASRAAIALGEFYRKGEQSQEAENYLKMVLSANPEYFKKNFNKSYNLLSEWTDSRIYNTPAQILESIYPSIFALYDNQPTPQNTQLRRDMLHDLGVWYDKAGNLQKAHEYYTKFMQELPKDDAFEAIKKADDALILRYDELDPQKRLEHYDFVLSAYAGKEEALVALVKKAETLFELKRYNEVFAMREPLSAIWQNYAQIIKESANPNEANAAPSTRAAENERAAAEIAKSGEEVLLKATAELVKAALRGEDSMPIESSNTADSIESKNTQTPRELAIAQAQAQKNARAGIFEPNCKAASFYGSIFASSIPLDSSQSRELFDCMFKEKQLLGARELARFWSGARLEEVLSSKNAARNTKIQSADQSQTSEKNTQMADFTARRESALNDPKERREWLYRLAWSEYLLSGFKAAANASRDVMSLIESEPRFATLEADFKAAQNANSRLEEPNQAQDSRQNTQADSIAQSRKKRSIESDTSEIWPDFADSVWVLFMSLENEKRRAEALTLLPRLQAWLPLDSRMIEVWRVALSDAIARNDENAIKSYASELVSAQTDFARYEFSPWVELAWTQSLIKANQHSQALGVINAAKLDNATPEQTAQVYYFQGYLNHNLGNRAAAKIGYERCAAVEAQSRWQALCKDAANFLEQQNQNDAENTAQGANANGAAN